MSPHEAHAQVILHELSEDTDIGHKAKNLQHTLILASCLHPRGISRITCNVNDFPPVYFESLYLQYDPPQDDHKQAAIEDEITCREVTRGNSLGLPALNQAELIRSFATSLVPSAGKAIAAATSDKP